MILINPSPACLCSLHKGIETEVLEFMTEVNSVGEESITDFLLWKWRKANKNFAHFNVEEFSKQVENSTTGADFKIDLNLWVISNAGIASMAIQAKKLTKETNSYLSKTLKYKSKHATDSQLDTLLKYTNKTKGLVEPFYMFYSKPEMNVHRGGIYLSHANYIKKLTNSAKGTTVTRTQILKENTMFHHLFCLNNTKHKKLRHLFFKRYLKRISIHKKLPKYAEYIIKNRENTINEDMLSYFKQFDLGPYKKIAVLDLREDTPQSYLEILD